MFGFLKSQPFQLVVLFLGTQCVYVDSLVSSLGGKANNCNSEMYDLEHCSGPRLNFVYEGGYVWHHKKKTTKLAYFARKSTKS